MFDSQLTAKLTGKTTHQPPRHFKGLPPEFTGGEDHRKHCVSALPVVDGKARVIGIVSEADLLLKEERRSLGERHLIESAVFSQEIRNYAGTQVDNGDKARVYANDFIGIHLTKVANGQSSAQVSSALQQDPKNTTLAAQKATLFQGEMLRSQLLQAYAWWTMGVYAGYAAIGTALATLAVLGALLFEIFVAVRRPEKVVVKRAVAAA